MPIMVTMIPTISLVSYIIGCTPRPLSSAFVSITYGLITQPASSFCFLFLNVLLITTEGRRKDGLLWWFFLPHFCNFQSTANLTFQGTNVLAVNVHQYLALSRGWAGGPSYFH